MSPGYEISLKAENGEHRIFYFKKNGDTLLDMHNWILQHAGRYHQTVKILHMLEDGELSPKKYYMGSYKSYCITLKIPPRDAIHVIDIGDGHEICSIYGLVQQCFMYCPRIEITQMVPGS